MKRSCFLLLIVLIGVCFSSAFAGEENEMTALDVMVKSNKLFRSAERERSLLEVSLVYEDERRRPLNKEMELTISSVDGMDEIKVVYLGPKKEEGTELTIQRKAQPPDIILFKSPKGREMRVSGANITAVFVWGLTREDVMLWFNEDPSKYYYAFLESSDESWLIKAVPKEGTVTGYSWREIRIGKEDFSYREIKYFGKHGKLEKIQINHDLIVFPSGLWRADRISMKRLDGSTTKIRVIKRELEERKAVSQ